MSNKFASGKSAGDLEKQIENLQTQIYHYRELAKMSERSAERWKQSYLEAVDKYIAYIESKPNRYTSIDPDSLRNRSNVSTLSK